MMVATLGSIFHPKLKEQDRKERGIMSIINWEIIISCESFQEKSVYSFYTAT